METRNGTAGNRDEHHRENGVVGGVVVTVLHAAPKFRNFRLIDDESHEDGHSHSQQQDAEDGVDLADKFVDGQERGNQIISQDDDNPNIGVPTLGEVGVQ